MKRAIALTRVPLMIAAFLWLSLPAVLAQGTAFTYQGRLQDNGTGANGNYDLQFALWDSAGAGAGTQIGTTQTVSNVAVSNGVFTVQLDFGAAAFSGANRFLEIAVRTAGGGAFVTLAPRQPITSTPYAVRSLNAASADAVVVSGVPSGSGNYIQNTGTQQASSNFNISGNGTAAGTLSGNIVNATTQYNIGINRVLSVAGTDNVFVGVGAGAANTTSYGNSFFGYEAGASNTIGCCGTFFGTRAGFSNMGNFSLRNSFFGWEAGYSTQSGSDNSFFGQSTGRNNTTGDDNAFFGRTAGNSNTDGDANSFFGRSAGTSNTTGSYNSFFGYLAGNANTVEDSNTFIGAESDGFAAITNATAMGYRAQVTQSNSLVLGSINGVNGATANTSVGIGTTAPSDRLHVAASLNAVATPTGHVALIENTSTGTSPDVLALKIGRVTDPDNANNFITFFKGDNTSAGSIQGNGSGGVVLGGPGSDYAEWLPRLNSKESIQPGDVVGVFNGRISKTTNGASQVMVISTGAIVAGNDPGTNARTTHSLVAFIGQAMVRVSGPVQTGDFIVSSGQGDGVGRAVSPESISTEQFAQVIGQAWETSAAAGINQVRVAVGLIRHDPTVKRLVDQSQNQAARIGWLEQKMAQLEGRLAASERKMQLPTVQRSTKRRNSSIARSQTAAR